MKYILKFSADVQFASRFVYTIRELVLSGFYFLNSSWGFPGGASGKESACNAVDTGEMGSIPGSVRFPGVGNGKPLPAWEIPWTVESFKEQIISILYKLL